jgi:hypothetical protein
MKQKANFLLLAIFSLSITVLSAQVQLIKNEQGHKLVVDGKDFMVNGMNWDYFPIGTNYSYSLWSQSDDIIKAALDSEMSLLRNMGVNSVRMYTGVPAKWITYIYEKYGIYTMLNHSFGRYGLTLDGEWVGNTEYSDPRVEELLLKEVSELAEQYQNTPGLLLYLLGNENNYGLFWEGAETEDIPIEQRKSVARATSMYKLFNKGALAMKGIDKNHPVAICNGDLLFLEIIVKECPDVDIFGTNMYRGVSFGDAFQRVADEYGKPILFTEFGADAFNAIENAEDQQSQAYYMVGNWKEIYQNAAGKGLANNSLGGYTFQFSDGWWKYGQTKNLDVHDNNASWSNGGYAIDLEEGQNNMNEEWFGVCAKGPTNERGLYQLYPRAAYYALKEAHQLNPYAPGATVESIETFFNGIEIMGAVIKARGDQAALRSESTKKIRMSGLRAELSTFNTGGENIQTPEDAPQNNTTYPDELGFDHMQSFFIGVEAQPTEGLRANVSFNVLGNVAENRINEIFYENQGRPVIVETANGETTLDDIQRVRVYRADINWNHEYFDLHGFYRTGHFHWAYEGDFFGLYPEANYGPNIDIYNGNAPSGIEVAGKKGLSGLKVAFGPELWWGANPAVLVKYRKQLAGFNITGIFHEDIDRLGPTVSSFAVPQPVTRRATLHIARKFGKFGIELGGIWGGQPLVGRQFQMMNPDNETDMTAYVDEVNNDDTWGGKAKITFSSGPFNWYAQGAAQGLVANGGADATTTFTGWRLKDSGSGNQTNFLTGFTLGLGNLQIAPNFLWQKPIVGPMAAGVNAPGRARNILDDPFVVRANRETVAGEILLTFDPTPGTWMYDWDSDKAEDAKFAMNVGFVYRHLPTIQDAAIGIFSDGVTLFPFPGSAPAEDLWEVHSRIVSKINPDFGIIANLYGGTAQANGDSERTIERMGGELQMIYKHSRLSGHVKINDWGPFDYHRDFNLTFPLQLMADWSIAVGKQSWLNLPGSRLGFSYIWRSLDQFSPRFCPGHIIDADGNRICNPDLPGADPGREWEFRTYLQINIGKI